jgi:hypothetical protein
MAFPRIGGAGIPLSVAGGLVPNFSGSPPVAAGFSNVITLSASETWLIAPGTYACAPGPYTCLQWLDPVQNAWRNVGADNGGVPLLIDSDGASFRLANLTGTPIGALITNAGSGYTNGIGAAATGLTVTPSAGGSTWVPVVGGANNGTVTITAGGSNYTFPPILIFDAPPAGGIQATGVCTISGGAINVVTVTNPGAGYTTVPNISVVNDPRDTTGSKGVLTAGALVGSGTLTALYPSAQGTALTAVPTFTFSPASTTAATAVMNFVVTGFTIGSGLSGTGYGNAQPFIVLGSGGIVSGTRAANVAGPIADVNLTIPRMAQLQGTSTAGGKAQASAVGASVVADAGFGFQAVPSLVILPNGSGAPSTVAQLTAAVGGITDSSWIQRI